MFERLRNSRRALPVLTVLLLIVLVLSMALSVSLGQADISFADVYRIVLYKLTGGAAGDVMGISDAGQSIVWLLRFPRVLMAALVGAALALTGTVMQASVQNPLADPYILGVSSGATLGAALAILAGVSVLPIVGQVGISFCAFAGALGASALVLGMATAGGRVTSSKLVLSGVVVDAVFGALSNLLIFFSSTNQGIKSLTFWTMGSMSQANWDKLPVLAVVVLAAIAFFLTQARTMNTMLMGNETAATLGVDLGRYRKLFLALTALLTGTAVACCGMIGFVGLVVPHIVRAVVGSDHRRLLPVAILFGAVFMVWADVVARAFVSGAELPIGIVTSAVGAPVFMYMLLRQRYGFGGE